MFTGSKRIFTNTNLIYQKKTNSVHLKLQFLIKTHHGAFSFLIAVTILNIKNHHYYPKKENLNYDQNNYVYLPATIKFQLLHIFFLLKNVSIEI